MKSVSNYLFVLAIATIFASSEFLCGELKAQEFGAFSGSGIPAAFAQKKEAPTSPKLRWPKLLDFSKDESTTQTVRPFSSLFKKPTFQKPNFEMFKRPNLFGGGLDSPKPFSGLANLFPKRDPNKPSFFAQMNAKSKSFIDRTSNRMSSWTNRGAEPKDKTFGTWDAITRDMREIQANQKPIHAYTEPAKPNIRTAEATDKPSVRF